MIRTFNAPSRLRRVAIGVLTLGLLSAGVLGGCSTLEESERGWIFQPRNLATLGSVQTPEGMTEEWIGFQSKAAHGPAKLNALWLPNDNPDAPVMLFLHGARWDVGSQSRRMRHMQGMGFSVLGIDYRGFGKTSNELPSEAYAYEDARAGWDWLAKHYPAKHRYIFGHSLGGAIAVNLASQVSDASGLILESTFTSIPAVFQTFRWGWLPITPLITQRFDAASKIGQVKAPVLVVHGDEDGVILPALGRALFDKAPEPKQFVLVPGGSHHSAGWRGEDQYRAALKSLFGIDPSTTPDATLAAKS
ncbi:MAG: hypothetical protein JWP52_2386 [Rhizobacter sp.]|nr:hypothetical protein [Rhizobacter sp.]